MPFISVESTSNNIPEELSNYIFNLIKKGYGITCMFDGDKAGKRAFVKFMESIIRLKTNNTYQFSLELNKDELLDEKIKIFQSEFKKVIGCNIDNFFKFNSNIDFTDHMIEEGN